MIVVYYLVEAQKQLSKNFGLKLLPVALERCSKVLTQLVNRSGKEVKSAGAP